MQFTSFVLSALSIGSALAQAGVTVHVVRVGSMNGSLAYYPNNIKAAVGDMVQFQFAPNNHTVTQSTFDAPCQPIAANSNVTGIYSGFMPVSASSTTTPTYTIMIKNTTPMWLYCSQGKHCQNGMTMVINENSTSPKTLSAYQALAAKATVNLPGTAVSGGSSNSSTGTGSGSGSGSGSGTETGTGTSASGTSAPQATSSGSAAHHVRAGDAMGLGGLFAVAIALFL
ncbi:Cupredoxin [Cadophora sp. MPI-SDFR-AT-0126]|nr:Cupredoxin [Leotiomycetes sp. MPI-SDFR-AT-0126]